MRAEVYDGARLPLDDARVDTVILLEVIEHLDDPAALLAEARRVASQRARHDPELHPELRPRADRVQPHARRRPPPVLHRGSLTALLDGVFGSCEVEQTAPIDRNLAGLVLPRPLRPLYRLLDRFGQAKPRYFTRLRARAPAR